MAKIKRLKDNYVDIEDPAFDPEAADPVETAASVIEAICPDMRITEIDTDGVYLPRPLSQEEGSTITDYLGISVPLECYNQACYLPVVDSVKGITDDLHEGDVYNDGEYSGVVKSVGSDTITIESQNEDGDVVDIEIPINDSADMDQFLMKIFMGKKATCPKTKHTYQIKGTSFYVDGKSTIDLPKDVVSAVSKVKSYIQKAKPISDDIHSYTDSNLDELFTEGVTVVTLGEDDTAEDLASLMEDELANYQAPNEEPILLKGEDNGDGTATITVEDY